MGVEYHDRSGQNEQRAELDHTDLQDEPGCSVGALVIMILAALTCLWFLIVFSVWWLS